MNAVRIILALLALGISVPGSATAQSWQTVYEEDFSTNPWWATNSPSRFYWDDLTQSYYTENYTNSQEWAGKYISYDGSSFRLAFDVMPVRESWETGDVNVGMFGPTKVSTSSSTEERVFITIGGYDNQIYVSGYDAGGTYFYSGAGSGLMQESVWHHVEITYDDALQQLSTTVTVSSVPVLVWETILGGGLSANLEFFGVSMTGSWTTSDRHETASIDNVLFEQELVQLTTDGGYGPKWSPDGSQMAFTSSRDGNSEVYLMSSDGADQTRLTDSPQYDKVPSWHPSGETIVFVTTRSGGHDIYTMNTDGSNQTPLITNSAWDDYPRWSPDGSKLLFESTRDGNYEVYLVNADGSDVTNLTENGAIDGNASWSPTGEKICFTSNRDGHYQIYVMNYDGTDQTNISNNPHSEDWSCWSPDGREILFTSDRDGNEELYLMKVDGSNQTRLTNNPGQDTHPHFAPDGKWIAFASDRDGLLNVYKMRAGSEEIRVCADMNYDGVGPDISDLVYIVSYMFQGGPAPLVLAACDVNGDGRPVPDISDLVYLATYMFQGGPEPVCQSEPR